MSSSQPDSVWSDFYGSLTLRARLTLLAAIFSMFAPVSVLLISRFAERRSVALLLLWAAMSGLTATGWAYAFMRSRKILWILLPGQLLWFVIPIVFRMDFRTGFTLSFEGIGCIVLIVGGYILFVNFIRGEGARRIRMQAELHLAQQIHASLIPSVSRTTAQLELFGRSLASSEMGGDLLDVVEEDGKVGVYIADVSGHGVRAGVLMGMTKSAIRMKLQASDAIGDLHNDVNRVICDLASPGMFVTAACLRFDGSSTVGFAGAGHGSVLHFQTAGRTLQHLESEYLPLGVTKDETYDPKFVTVAPGDVFLLMTDGLTEVFDRQGRPLGQEAIEAVFIRNATQSLPDLYAAIMEAVARHGPRSDDQTLLLARVR
jgi:hypothetical protein